MDSMNVILLQGNKIIADETSSRLTQTGLFAEKFDSEVIGLTSHRSIFHCNSLHQSLYLYTHNYSLTSQAFK
jgi:hypothetical protein